MIIRIIALTLSLLFCTQAHSFDDNTLVKKTKSGICHPPESPYWDRIKINEDNVLMPLSQCLSQGGRLPDYLQEVHDKEQELKNLISDPNKSNEVIAYATKEFSEVNEKPKQYTKNIQEFGGIKFNIGIALTYLDSNVIREVAIEDGRVRIKREGKNKAEIFFETHKYIWTPEMSGDLAWGHGPFLAASITSDDKVKILDRYMVGWMFGFKDLKKEDESWNIGIGKFFDTSVIKLRNGIVEDSETSETNVDKIIKKGEESGIGFMFSASW